MNQFNQVPQGANSEGLSKQAKAFGFVKSKFDKATDDLNSLVKSIESHGSSEYESQPRPTWSGPVGDGGMDIQDRVVEEGSVVQEEREHDYYTSDDALKHMHEWEEEIADLHEAMTQIEAGDEEVINRYLDEMQKPAK